MDVGNEGKAFFLPPKDTARVLHERPSTEDPATLVLLDYVENLRKAALTAASAMEAMAPTGQGERARWTHYERLSSIFRTLEPVKSAINEVQSLGREWGIPGTVLADWIHTNVEMVRRHQEGIRSRMASVRPSICGHD